MFCKKNKWCIIASEASCCLDGWAVKAEVAEMADPKAEEADQEDWLILLGEIQRSTTPMLTKS